MFREKSKAFQADKSVEWRMGMPASSDQADVILLFGGDGTIHRHLGSTGQARSAGAGRACGKWK